MCCRSNNNSVNSLQSLTLRSMHRESYSRVASSHLVPFSELISYSLLKEAVMQFEVHETRTLPVLYVYRCKGKAATHVMLAPGLQDTKVSNELAREPCSHSRLCKNTQRSNTRFYWPRHGGNCPTKQRTKHFGAAQHRHALIPCARVEICSTSLLQGKKRVRCQNKGKRRTFITFLMSAPSCQAACRCETSRLSPRFVTLLSYD